MFYFFPNFIIVIIVSFMALVLTLINFFPKFQKKKSVFFDLEESEISLASEADMMVDN